jgi:hypothetical protein
MLLDSHSDDGLILSAAASTAPQNIAKTFGKCERTIRRWGLPRIKVGSLFLARIPEWTPAGRAGLGAWR